LRAASRRATTLIDIRLRYLYQTLIAVQFMHDNRYIHLDIKTDNVFVQRSTARLADFGFARRVIDINTGIALVSSYITPAFRPPEAYNKINGVYIFTDKSDIWTLGHLVVEVLTGRRLFPMGDNFNKPDPTKKYIEEEFSKDTVKASLIRDAVSPLPVTLQLQVSILLHNIFNHDPKRRPSIATILSSPIFNGTRNLGVVSGTIAKSLRIDPLPDTPQYIDLMYKFMKATWPQIDSRVFFCAADIYYRGNRGTVIPGYAEDILRTVREALVGISIWNAIKMIFGYVNSEYTRILSWLSPTGISPEYFDSLETTLYMFLGGDMDSPHLYDICTGKNQLQYVFKTWMMNDKAYNTLDLDVAKSLLPISDGQLPLTKISDLDA
jgi:serine/threonine protein kinase